MAHHYSIILEMPIRRRIPSPNMGYAQLGWSHMPPSHTCLVKFAEQLYSMFRCHICEHSTRLPSGWLVHCLVVYVILWHKQRWYALHDLIMSSAFNIIFFNLVWVTLPLFMSLRRIIASAAALGFFPSWLVTPCVACIHDGYRQRRYVKEHLLFTFLMLELDFLTLLFLWYMFMASTDAHQIELDNQPYMCNTTFLLTGALYSSCGFI